MFLAHFQRFSFPLERLSERRAPGTAPASFGAPLRAPAKFVVALRVRSGKSDNALDIHDIYIFQMNIGLI